MVTASQTWLIPDGLIDHDTASACANAAHRTAKQRVAVDKVRARARVILAQSASCAATLRWPCLRVDAPDRPAAALENPTHMRTSSPRAPLSQENIEPNGFVMRQAKRGRRPKKAAEGKAPARAAATAAAAGASVAPRAAEKHKPPEGADGAQVLLQRCPGLAAAAAMRSGVSPPLAKCVERHSRFDLRAKAMHGRGPSGLIGMAVPNPELSRLSCSVEHIG